MTWPPSVRIGAVEVEIRTVHRDALPDDHDGDFRTGSGQPVVRVADDLVGAYRDYVILHELAHAWIAMAEIGLPQEQEEMVVGAVAHGVLQLLEARR